MTLLERRRAMMTRVSEDASIYEAKNILFNGSATDTGVLLSHDGSSGWTIFYKIDASQVSSITYGVTNNSGFYQYYYHFYVNAAQAVYGIKGFEPWWDLRFLPEDDRKKWINTFAVSANFDTMACVAFANNQVRRGSISEFSASTAPLLINPGEANNGIVIDEFRIYDYPMTEAQLQNLIES